MVGAHLPRERIEHHPPQEALVCPQCGGTKEPMGEEITEQLDYVPASFIVRTTCAGEIRLQAVSGGRGDRGFAGAADGEGPAGRGAAGAGAHEQVWRSLCATNLHKKGGVVNARNCERDEGRPLEAGLQEQASNHLKLLWSRARVVSVKEKACRDMSGRNSEDEWRQAPDRGPGDAPKWGPPKP